MDNRYLSKYKNHLMNISLFVCTFLNSFLLLEISARYFFPPPPVPRNCPRIYNFADYKIYDIGLGVFDEELGWVNKPNAAGYGMFGEYLSFDAMTFRNNNNNITLKNRPVILAVGDSYTVGVEVDNADTWPSQLEIKSRIRVLNGGVGGYGLDQMLTRTRSLLKNMTVDYVIVAFSEEDIRRVRQKKQYSIMKPLYKIENNKLLSSRVKMADYPPPDYFKKIFGYSYVVHLFMSKLFKEYWSKGGLQDMEYEDINEIEISCKIIDGFVEIAEAQKVKYVIFVLLPKHYNDCSLVNHPVAKYIKNISEKNKRIFLIDLQTELLNMKIFNQEKNPEIRAFFNDHARGYHGHFSKEGNEFVAQTIHSFLRSEKAYGSIP